MGPRIVHFEIPVRDQSRAKAFYGGLFGWGFEDVPEMGDYTLVSCDERGPNGGLLTPAVPMNGILTYIDVADVGVAQERAEQLGAEVVKGRSPVPGVGWFSILKDTEGNEFAVWQDDETAGLS